MLEILLIAAYVSVPPLLLRAHRFWGVPAATLSLWLPVESGVLVAAGIDPLPVLVLAVGTGLLTFWSRPDALDVRKAFNLFTVQPRPALMHFLLFAVIGAPLGLMIGFIRPVIDVAEFYNLPIMAVTIFFFNALPEETLFRGLIQNWLEKHTGTRTGALVVSAVVFGASHLNNGAPVPNYKYMLMATLAGVFYGLAWRSRKNVLTSSITHTLVNTSWNLFFR